MAQLAIFIDGAYAAKIAAQNLRIWIDYEKLSNAIRDMIAGSTQEPLDLLRTYFYDCLPYQSDPPTPEEVDRFSKKLQQEAPILFRVAASAEVQGSSGPSETPWHSR